MTAEADPGHDAIRCGAPDGESAEFGAIILHGLGASGHDLAPLAQQLPALAKFRSVFPHAPMRAVTVNMGMNMRAWYDIAGADLQQNQDAEGIEKSSKALRNLIDEEIESGIPAERLFLGGFSQGGAMSLHIGLRSPVPLAGIISLSGYLPLSERLDAEISSCAGRIPVFMGHGTFDPIVPVAEAHASRDLLENAGIRVEYREYPIGHSISFEEAEALNGWINRTTAAAA